MNEANGNKTQWRNTPQKKSFWGTWTLKSKILLIFVVLLAVLLCMNLVPGENLVSTIGSEVPTLILGYRIDLDESGDGNILYPDSNMVMVPYSVLTHTDGTMEGIFGALADETNQRILVKYIDPNYGEHRFDTDKVNNELDTVDPYKIYYVYVEKDCTLDLSLWDYHIKAIPE